VLSSPLPALHQSWSTDHATQQFPTRSCCVADPMPRCLRALAQQPESELCRGAVSEQGLGSGQVPMGEAHCRPALQPGKAPKRVEELRHGSKWPVPGSGAKSRLDGCGSQRALRSLAGPSCSTSPPQPQRDRGPGQVHSCRVSCSPHPQTFPSEYYISLCMSGLMLLLIFRTLTGPCKN